MSIVTIFRFVHNHQSLFGQTERNIICSNFDFQWITIRVDTELTVKSSKSSFQYFFTEKIKKNKPEKCPWIFLEISGNRLNCLWLISAPVTEGLWDFHDFLRIFLASSEIPVNINEENNPKFPNLQSHYFQLRKLATVLLWLALTESHQAQVHQKNRLISCRSFRRHLRLFLPFSKMVTEHKGEPSRSYSGDKIS